MNHAFLIIAHDSPDLLQRIIDRLEAPNHFVFVHYDKKYQCPPLRIRYGECIPEEERIRVYWGGFSLIQIELVLLRHAFNYPDRIDYFHLISGHDYPCVSNEEFDNYFRDAPRGMSFMYFVPENQPLKWKEEIDRRVNKWHFNEAKLGRLGESWVENLINTILPRRKFDYDIHSGWQWFSWHRSLVEWVLSYCDNNPKYLKRFNYTECCDEVFFHSLLYSKIDELKINKDNSLRFIDWYPQRTTDSLPLILDERDCQAIQESGALFCRKCYIDKSRKLLEILDLCEKMKVQ